MALSRRLTLGMAAVAAAPPSLAAADEDTVLLERCANFHVARAARTAWIASEVTGPIWEARWDALCGADECALEAVLATPARTMTGLGAKARVVHAATENLRAGPLNDDERAMVRLVEELRHHA